MNIAICDDCEKDMIECKSILKEVLTQRQIPINIYCYHSGESLLLDISNTNITYDLVLLDIYMGKMTGVDTAEQLHALLPNTYFAFLTTSKDFALDAIHLDALHYILKPIDTAKMTDLIHRLCERNKIPESTLEIHSNHKSYSFLLHRIVKILSSKKGVDVYLEHEMIPHHLPISFTNVENQLNPNLFLTISRGFMVQMSFIRSVDNDSCYLKDGTSHFLSRKHKAEIRQKYNDFLFQ